MNKADGTILSGGCMMGSNPCKEMLLQITKILEREMNMNIKELFGNTVGRWNALQNRAELCALMSVL